jgi:uncharacterized membrane protein YccC
MHIVPYQADQWLVITIIVVMCAQINVGSVLQKSTMRFLGTCSGSALAALTLLAFGVNPIAIAATIILCSAGFSYIATGEKSYSDAGTLGAVTVVIILLGTKPTLTNAMHRFTEISLGILIATLVSQFVLPIRARDHLRRAQAKTLAQIGEYYRLTFVANPNENEIQELDEAIVKSLSAQRSLGKQAAREPFGEAFDPVYFSQLLHCEKEIFRSIVCMHYASEMLPPENNVFVKMASVQKFHEAVCLTFDKISAALLERKATQGVATIPSIEAMRDAIHAIRPVTAKDDIVYLDGFLFCAEILTVQVTRLVLLFPERAV